MNRLMATTAVALTMTFGASAFAANQGQSRTMTRVDIDAVCMPGGYESGEISENMYLVIDTDKSGSVSTEEYVTACIQAAANDQALGARARTQAQSNFSMIDADRDGEISMEEYATAATRTDTNYERLYSMDDRFGGMRANQVIGQPVYDASGNEIGQIENVVHSSRLNRTYTVVAVGKQLGAGERVVVVPVDRFQVDNDRVVYRGVSRQTIDLALDYDPNVYLPWKPENPVNSKEDRLQNTN